MNYIHHSAAVHIPLSLALLLPLSQVVLFILVKIKYLPDRVWYLQWAMAGIQLIACGVAYFTGQRDYVLSAADPELLQHHREMALALIAASIPPLILLPLLVKVRSHVGLRAIHILLLMIFVAQIALAIYLGQSGGRILFGS